MRLFVTIIALFGFACAACPKTEPQPAPEKAAEVKTEEPKAEAPAAPEAPAEEAPETESEK